MATSSIKLTDAVAFLQRLITIPSFSNEEDNIASLWEYWLRQNGANCLTRFHNNVYAVSSSFDPEKPVLLLNSHMDTVKPVDSYLRDPFSPDIIDGRIYGLGSNDAGASGVALAMTFLSLQHETRLPVNLIFAITASEERMGEFGMRAFLPHLKDRGLYPDMAIVGEPTGMQPAIAERGLVVLDGVAYGKSGHAARNEGINALYQAIEDIEILRNFNPPRRSECLGPVKVSVTMIQAGTQHNVVPDTCSFVVDVRTTDAYSNEETVRLLQESVKWSELKPRSLRIQASVISSGHPLVEAARALGLKPFISPTTSDMALMHDIPSLKIGPGKSERSHSADEFIEIEELKEALDLYPQLIKKISLDAKSI